MASWLVHLRVADRILSKYRYLSHAEFIVGNIAPDSGIPNENWTQFTPSTDISHFKTGKHAKAEPATFIEKYLTAKQQDLYANPIFSFYLGYLVHLITDVEWSESVYYPAKVKFAEEYEKDPEGFIWKLKKDWYDLDFLYLREHPDFRAFRLYTSAEGFKNTYIDEFSEDAFDIRRKYIVDYYQQCRVDIDREFRYLTETELNAFVDTCVKKIMVTLKEDLNMFYCM